MADVDKRLELKLSHTRLVDFVVFVVLVIVVCGKDKHNHT